MDIQELSNFVDWTLNEWRYPSYNEDWLKERSFAQMIKISEEVWELGEQVLWKFGWQRTSKQDKISDEKLNNEIADVIISTIRLARLMNKDIQILLDSKIRILKERFSQES